MSSNGTCPSGRFISASTLLPGRQQRRKDTLAELTGLHADIDFKGVDATPAEIEKALRQLQLPPSCINFSGHGFHCYWLFREALAATPENNARVETALRRLAITLPAIRRLRGRAPDAVAGHAQFQKWRVDRGHDGRRAAERV